jgi:nucleotide-binding universal stress UspA family protein
MKNILVPTDFSACAKNATYAALDLAMSHHATLHLITVLNNDGTNASEAAQQKHNAEILMMEWKEIAAEKRVNIKTEYASGNLIECIRQYIQEHHIDFVVMGSHGVSGKQEYFIGSNAQKVIRAIHSPVLIIKKKLASIRIHKVVFASNFNTTDKEPFQYLLNFVAPFHPEIHLLQINTSGWFNEPYPLVKEAMDDFKAMCGQLDCKVHFHRDWTIDAGIRHLSEGIGADLVAISNQQRHPLKRIFTGSNVEALVNHSDIPVLSIDLGADA